MSTIYEVTVTEYTVDDDGLYDQEDGRVLVDLVSTPEVTASALRTVAEVISPTKGYTAYRAPAAPSTIEAIHQTLRSESARSPLQESRARSRFSEPGA